MDNSYIEYGIFLLWKLDLYSFVQLKASLSKEFSIQPSEIDKMPVWEYELFVKCLNNLVKEENDAQKKKMDEAGIGDMQKNMKNPSKMFGEYKIPKMTMPKMNIPKI